MKKFLKFVSSIFALALIGFIVTNTSYAKDTLSNEKVLNPSNVTISITNDKTGEVTYLDPIETKKLLEINSIDSNKKSTVVGYDVFVPLDSSGIKPLDSSGGEQNEGGVRAKLYVDYDVNATNEKVRLNRVYGSWTPTSSLYYLTDRHVDAHSGTPYGKKLSKKPTSNSFSYVTGWGYNDRVWGDLSPRAWSSAKIHVSGMSSTHTIKVNFTYS